MGVCYVPMLLDDHVKQWLQSDGVAFPLVHMRSRWPTPKELRSVLESLPGYSVSYRPNAHDGWDAEIEDETRGVHGLRATIWTKNASDDAKPNEFSFHKPSLELALLILERLSHVCG